MTLIKLYGIKLVWRDTLVRKERSEGMDNAIAEGEEEELWLVSGKIRFSRSTCLSFQTSKIRKRKILFYSVRTPMDFKCKASMA